MVTSQLIDKKKSMETRILITYNRHWKQIICRTQIHCSTVEEERYWWKSSSYAAPSHSEISSNVSRLSFHQLATKTIDIGS